MGKLPAIGTLWVGDQLSWLEQLCLKSFLDHGHEVVLFKYDDVANVPDGVRIEDANQILPADKIIRHAKTGSPAYHADVFRLHMLAQTDCIWADTDAFCTQPWHLKPDSHLHGWIAEADLVNNGVLGLPKNSKTLARMFEFTADEYPIPPWFKPAKQAELRALKDQGKGVHVSLLPWGVWGPNALTWFLKETGEIKHSSPGHVLFPLPFPNAGFPLNPRRVNKVESFIQKDTLSIHLWGRRFRNIAAKYNGRPEKGCYIAKMLKKHRIDPVKTAYLMPAPEDKDVEVNVPTTLDFSTFKSADIANMVLQRPAVGKTGPALKAWVAGNDTALLDFAESNKDTILQNTLTIACNACGGFLRQTDKINPTRIADIGCGYGFAALMLYRRYSCDIVLIDIEKTKTRHFGYKATGAGFSNLTRAKAFLMKNGVPKSKIQVLNPTKQDLSIIKPVDLAISLASCGFHYPVDTYANFFENRITPDGGIVLDIRKGSGGIKTMKDFGAVTVLRKHPKHSTVFAKKPAGNPQ
ncbi:MAG: class I SAM-dependent methyltransferase [Rhodobacterales bacterium]